ncbi:MAG: hypothetical protein ACF8TS_01515, partial [Maioricimonas sp. JB049]
MVFPETRGWRRSGRGKNATRPQRDAFPKQAQQLAQLFQRLRAAGRLHQPCFHRQVAFNLMAVRVL